MEELIALCLLAKLWGEVLPIALIIAKTKVDWKHIKGTVKYIDLRNGWVLLRFTTVSDKEYVWFNRPWFVKGLNLVLSAWKPYFDPYSATISRVDQWDRILRLPWEFWEQETLADILRNVGNMVCVDHNTLLRQKEKFTRVCLNIDISKPLPGTLRIPTPFRELSIPLIYEGLHEVCALCESNAHSLDQCPKVPSFPKIEVIVEPFQSHRIVDGPPFLTPLMRHHPVTLLTIRKNGFGLPQKREEDPLSFLGTREIIQEESVSMNHRCMCQSCILFLSLVKHLHWTRGKERLSWLT